MPLKIPKQEHPSTYQYLQERFELLRPHICKGLEEDFLPSGSTAHEKWDAIELYESDVELRESVAEVLLASILWVEAGKPSGEILQGCSPEIKHQFVYTVNVFRDFLILRSAVQKDRRAGLGNLATAWIHLFVEFHAELTRLSGPCWWRSKSRSYS